MRLIDADYFDKILIDAQEKCAGRNNTFKFGFLATVRANLEKCPSVDAVLVRHGRWIEEGTAHPALGLSYYICSECKQFWGTFHKGFRLNTVYEYCPHCGADMREGEKDG